MNNSYQAVNGFGRVGYAGRISLLFGIFWVLLGAAQIRAQVLDDALFTVGTTTVDASNRRWAYILFQPTDPGQMNGRKIAVYRKTGDATSGSSYERRTILTPQANPLIIQALMDRAVNLGDDLGALENRVNDLFLELLPEPSMKLNDKLALVIRGSQGRPEHLSNLLLLGRLHPSVNLCLGLAHAEQIPAPGLVTFEAREFDLIAGIDLSTLGRVTVDANAPTILPAPGRPAPLLDSSAKGNLNVRLRWATSAELRRLGLLSYGFNVYRVARVYAEAQNFHVQPPTLGQLAGLIVTRPADVQRVNNLPVLKTRDFDTDAHAANFNEAQGGDARTVFMADDHGLALDQPPFLNGEQFYYFATARDVLGRDGHTSPGVLVTMCDRVPPPAPRTVRVENHYRLEGNIRKQNLKIVWRPLKPQPGKVIIGYHVHRWAEHTDSQKFGGNPLVNRISPLIPHNPGAPLLEFIDDGEGAPTLPADADRTKWYTVVAVDNGACDGGNVSPHSAPAFGVLRSREGPDGPGGSIAIQCCLPLIQAGTIALSAPITDLDPDRVWLDLSIQRKTRNLEWVEFYVGGTQAIHRVARVNFKDSSHVIRHRHGLNRRRVGSSVTVHARVGTAANQVSAFAELTTREIPGGRQVLEMGFVGDEDCRFVPLGPVSSRDDCSTHNPHPKGPGGLDGQGDGGGKPQVGPKIKVALTPGTKEYRIYRRVNDGALSLLRQGEAAVEQIAEVEIQDNDVPAAASTVCYYGQLFDEHGNASPMTPIGECVEIQQPGPKPMLAALEAEGGDADPRMIIRWFCPPAGIERFEILLRAHPGGEPLHLSPELSKNLTSTLGQIVNENVPNDESYGTYETPAVGVGFGPGPEFTITVPVKAGNAYDVQINSVPKAGGVKRRSNARRFQWIPGGPPVGPDVPWPARPVPEQAQFHPGIASLLVQSPTFSGLAVRIGQVENVERRSVPYGTVMVDAVTGHVNPVMFCYTNALGQTLVPSVVLYRYQMPNTAYPKVSGDLIQVSPLMENIAHDKISVNGDAVTRILDPLIRLVSPNTVLGTDWQLCLLDTQPAVRRAQYSYLMVRMGKDGEVEEVIPVPPVTVP
jgi:hypothetical protein